MRNRIKKVNNFNREADMAFFGLATTSDLNKAAAAGQKLSDRVDALEARLIVVEAESNVHTQVDNDHEVRIQNIENGAPAPSNKAFRTVNEG